jgi:hypothetical protein
MSDTPAYPINQHSRNATLKRLLFTAESAEGAEGDRPEARSRSKTKRKKEEKCARRIRHDPQLRGFKSHKGKT